MDSGAIRAAKEGYMAHNMDSFTCPKCGWDTFESYPQGMSVEAEVWGNEVQCERCGHIVTLYLKR